MFLFILYRLGHIKQSWTFFLQASALRPPPPPCLLQPFLHCRGGVREGCMVFSSGSLKGRKDCLTAGPVLALANFLLRTLDRKRTRGRSGRATPWFISSYESFHYGKFSAAYFIHRQFSKGQLSRFYQEVNTRGRDICGRAFLLSHYGLANSSLISSHSR